MSRAGVHIQALQGALNEAISRLPQVTGTGGDIQIGRELAGLLNQADKEAQKLNDTFIASEMFLLAVSDDKGDAGKLARQHGSRARRSKPRSPRCAAARRCTARTRKASARR